MKHARDRRLVLHIGLHKTATTFLQNVLSMRRYDLLQQGVLYPTAGTAEGVLVKTREGAQSGHILFTRPGQRQRKLVGELLAELPDSARTVLVSSEDYTLPGVEATPEEHLRAWSVFGRVEVVLVLRRQDQWIESYYKQQVDQYGNFETRSFDGFVNDLGSTLLDFHSRFAPWRDLVGPENFHVLSYDDVADGRAICEGILEIAGIGGDLLETATDIEVPRYESVRAVDTLGLRVLNGYRLRDRDARIGAATAIYDAAPEGDIELMTPELREGIQRLCGPINERIEREWFAEPVPGFRFGAEVHRVPTAPVSAAELVAYLDQTIAICEAARAQLSSAQPDAAAGPQR